MTSSPIHRRIWMAVLCGAVLSLDAIPPTQQRDRATTPVQRTWNLADLFGSDAAWQEALDGVARDAEAISRFKGRVLSSATALADALELRSTIGRRFGRVAQYANLLADQDTRDGAHQAMRERVRRLGSTLQA